MMLRNLATNSMLLAALLSPDRNTPSDTPDTRRAVGAVRDTICQPLVEQRQVGERLFNDSVAKFGRYTGPWLHDVDSLMGALLRAAHQPGLQVTWAVINDDHVQAYAITGGQYMIINRGLLTVAEVLAAPHATGDLARQHELARGYVFAVLGHELAHHTLGHTTGCVVTDETVSASQTRELAADRVGALYTLRAGGQIQSAMDFWRDLDSLSRAEGSAYQLDATTYVSDHPRHSTREAALEIFRGKLKLDQGYFDDAWTLISNNLGLDEAIRLLDDVLADFPDLLEASHARATAYELRWLNSLPVAVQQVRPSLWAYSARFLPSIRGTELLNSPDMRSAKESFVPVLEHADWARTVSNAALLDAYAGNPDTAEAMARRAAMSAPQDPSVRNNLGVVYYLRGNYALARTSFEDARARQPEYAPFVFNLGRTLYALHDPQATAVLNQYLRMDSLPTSPWHAEAVRLLGGSGAAPTAATGASRAAAALPTLAEVRLGATGDEALRVLGTADTTLAAHDTMTYVYRGRRMWLLVRPDRRVGMIVIAAPLTGSLDGVRVGDRLEKASTVWGRPSDGDAEQGVSVYNRGEYAIVVSTAPNTDIVATLGVALTH